MKLCIENTLYSSPPYWPPLPPHTHTHLDEKPGCYDASFHLSLKSVVGQRSTRPDGGSDWETNRNQKPVVPAAPQGVIHFLWTFPFYVFSLLPQPSLSLSISVVVMVCRERQNKCFNSQMKSFGRNSTELGCLLADGGSFALEKQIQTRYTLLVLWTASTENTLPRFSAKENLNVLSFWDLL